MKKICAAIKRIHRFEEQTKVVKTTLDKYQLTPTNEIVLQTQQGIFSSSYSSKLDAYVNEREGQEIELRVFKDLNRIYSYK